MCLPVSHWNMHRAQKSATTWSMHSLSAKRMSPDPKFLWGNMGSNGCVAAANMACRSIGRRRWRRIAAVMISNAHVEHLSDLSTASEYERSRCLCRSVHPLISHSYLCLFGRASPHFLSLDRSNSTAPQKLNSPLRRPKLLDQELKGVEKPS